MRDITNEDSGDTVYIVGEYIAETEHGVVWDFIGAFDDVEKAENACRNERYFVCLCAMNIQAPEARGKWPYCYYPKAAGT